MPAQSRHNSRGRALSQADFHLLSEFRWLLRRFQAFSETAAIEAGLTPQQHQALLAIKGFDGAPTIGDLAERLLVRHNTTVGLVDRLERMRLITRRADPADRRKVTLALTAKAETLLAGLTATHRDELSRLSSELIPLLSKLT